MNIIKWTNTRTYCTDKNMLLTNLTIARFQRKIRKFRLARSLTISYICFQVRIVKKKGKKKKPYYQLLRKIWWLSHSGDITLSITPDDHLEGPYLLKTRELPGAPPPGPPAGALPLHPARGPTAGPWTPPVWGARGALRARIFPPTPFLQILDQPLYTSPLARPSRLPPEASILGELGSSRPPPPQWKYWGANISFPPPPPQ